MATGGASGQTPDPVQVVARASAEVLLDTNGETHAPRSGLCGKGGAAASVLTLIGTSLGGGLLSVPYVLRLTGSCFGIGLLMFGGFFAHIGMVALMEMSTLAGAEGTSYAKLLAHCLGPKAGPVLDFLLFIYGIGACTGYLILIGDFVPELVKAGLPAGKEAPWYLSRSMAILVSTALCLPTKLQKEVSFLRFLTPVSLGSLVYAGIVIMVESFELFPHNHGTPDFGEVTIATLDIHFFKAIGLCSFAFNCHLNVVPVAAGLACTTKGNMRVVSGLANLIPFIFYAIIGITGYLSFLKQTPEDILSGYKTGDTDTRINHTLFIIARVLLTFSMLVVIPANGVPTIRSGMQFFDALCGGRLALQQRELREVSESNCEQTAARPEDSTAPALHSGAAEYPTLLRLAVGAACLAVEAGIALKVKDISLVNGLLGSSISVIMMAIIPAFCMQKMLPPTLGTRLKQGVLLLAAAVNLIAVPLLPGMKDE